ncbi:carbohydrate ABC transporter permease [Candidatus Entotheonella palauensis]|uniref:carbohydrate ABC transporter permease n=1 Tax=Candidatus Entotheonella palauensis TaxID=93172 RepID=UPI000B801909|nr:carbohydrate ABC transporter permease [Candidatus Entotheonella palauensis]
MLNRKQRDAIVGTIWNMAALLIILLPIASLLIGAFQSEKALLSDVKNPLPKEITLINFIALFGGNVEGIHFPGQVGQFPLAFRNSAIVAISTATLSLIIGSLSAYTVVRLRFFGREAYSFALLATRMVPVIVLVIPLFLTFRGLSILNTLSGLVIAQMGLLLPFVVWIMRAYFETLPEELEAAARVDGCTRLMAFLRIIVPLSAPGMASCFVIIFLLSWNDLLIPIILGSQASVLTLPVLLSSFVSDYSLQYSVVNATAVLAMAPTAILALLLQKYVVAGLTAGAVKG